MHKWAISAGGGTD